MTERQRIAQALAKAQAYRDCGNTEERDLWAAELIRLLGAAHILKTHSIQHIES